MGFYLRAELTRQADDQVTYWVHDGLDREQGETLVILLNDFGNSYTVGCDHLSRWSAAMAGKICHTWQQGRSMAGQGPTGHRMI